MKKTQKKTNDTKKKSVEGEKKGKNFPRFFHFFYFPREREKQKREFHSLQLSPSSLSPFSVAGPGGERISLSSRNHGERRWSGRRRERRARRDAQLSARPPRFSVDGTARVPGDGPVADASVQPVRVCVPFLGQRRDRSMGRA